MSDEKNDNRPRPEIDIEYPSKWSFAIFILSAAIAIAIVKAAEHYFP